MQATMDGAGRQAHAGLPGTSGTALLALLAGLPCLLLTGAAALSANALAIWTDFLLTLIDAATLAVVWWTARPGRVRPDGTDRTEARVLVFVGLCMAASLIAVCAMAAGRILADAVVVAGPGIWLALAQNGVYAALNGWILGRWRRRMRAAPGAVVHAQLRLFSDKLCCNLILVASLGGSLAIADVAVAAALDAATGILLAAMSAWWSAPVLVAACRRLAAAPH